MSRPLQLTAYVGRANSDKLLLRVNNESILPFAVVKAEFVLLDPETHTQYCLSTANPADPIKMIDEDTTIKMQLGLVSFANDVINKTLPAHLVIYDQDAPQGLAWWGTTYQVTFIPWAVCV